MKNTASKTFFYIYLIIYGETFAQLFSMKIQNLHQTLNEQISGTPLAKF